MGTLCSNRADKNKWMFLIDVSILDSHLSSPLFLALDPAPRSWIESVASHLFLRQLIFGLTGTRIVTSLQKISMK